MRYKIVIDSCGELLDEWKQDEHFESVPLTLMVGAEQIIDDETFKQGEFLHKVAECPECPKSACPSPERYMRAYDCEAEHVYAVTLSAELSGSYNSALLGRNLSLEDHPDKKIHVFNSRSACIGETLIALKIEEYAEAGASFEAIVEKVEAYIRHQETFFVLDNLETLRKNGRLTGVKAALVSVLNIKPVMMATPEGTIEQCSMGRGTKKALKKMVEEVGNKVSDFENRIFGISHCNCLERAIFVKEEIEKRYPFKKIVIADTAGVGTMYANDGGVVIAF